MAEGKQLLTKLYTPVIKVKRNKTKKRTKNGRKEEEEEEYEYDLEEEERRLFTEDRGQANKHSRSKNKRPFAGSVEQREYLLN